VLFALIPYITLEDDAAEVWITDVPAPPTTPDDVVAILANFADTDDREAIADHCADWRADRVLLPNAEGTGWRAVRIDAALEGRLVEPY